MTFKTESFWNDLAKNGKVHIVVNRVPGAAALAAAPWLNCIREQLYSEAKAEGIRLSIKIDYTNPHFTTLYAYLRKRS